MKNYAADSSHKAVWRRNIGRRNSLALEYLLSANCCWMLLQPSILRRQWHNTDLLPPCPAIDVPETWHTRVTSRIVTPWFRFWQLKCQRWGCCWSCECPFTKVRMVSTAIFGHRLVQFPLAPRTDFNLGTSRQEAPSNLSDFLSSLSSELQCEGFLLLESFLIGTFSKLLVSDA